MHAMCRFEAAIYNYCRALDFECDDQIKEQIKETMKIAQNDSKKRAEALRLAQQNIHNQN